MANVRKETYGEGKLIGVHIKNEDSTPGKRMFYVYADRMIEEAGTVILYRDNVEMCRFTERSYVMVDMVA